MHLEEFISKVQCLKKPKDFCLANFWDLVRKLEVKEDWISDHVNFRDDTYARNLVALTPRFEMLVLCWKPGQNSRIHDHMESFSVVKVIRGTLTNHLYERLDDGRRPEYCDVRETRADVLGPGEYAPLDWGGIHMMENDPRSGENLVTLHFYAEPLRDIHLFDAEHHKVEVKRMRYSLEDRI
ncbi:MAG TPA: cysteine dioxygenase family protein [Planctomycetota bacterium]|nr:cysteine dioxygenase family protein [Planctomycetota bacterium]